MSIEAAIAENTAALRENTEILKRVVAGQEAAMAKLDGKPAATRATRKAKDEPAAAETPAPAAEPAAETASFLPTVAVGDTEGFKGIITPWLGGAEKGSAEAKDRVDFLMGLANHLGAEPKNFFGPVAADAAKLKEALFLFKRKEAGLDVEFGADYDLDGDPKQDAPAGDAGDGDFG